MAYNGVDWKQAPKLARWWALDADGKAHWYCEPDVAASADFWIAAELAAPDFDYEGSWRESLVERPVRPLRSA
ncbi:hypothetical protein [Pollutimonas bauzanensis]|uniref:Uncharacterized protein n=1 Tax=Pollutimonas bauzanensis TaxID=658167 RepID=A0A1M5MMG3_9BURK|nr:hypothetical protein [Pollutimonas bauzanensis]SHG78498.1 hypothetical protein SAMN04488135_101264 [Pollutimonas bauzanensis]